VISSDQYLFGYGYYVSLVCADVSSRADDGRTTIASPPRTSLPSQVITHDDEEDSNRETTPTAMTSAVGDPSAKEKDAGQGNKSPKPSSGPITSIRSDVTPRECEVSHLPFTLT
jgi:hypothetical protein